MPRLHRVPVVMAVGVLACMAPTQFSLAGSTVTATEDEAVWKRRVRLVWRTHNWFGYSPARQQEAEKAVLSEGKARAAAALRPMLQRPLEDPLCLQAAFTLALLDLDDGNGRDILLRYLRALALNRGPVEVDWQRLTKADADPEGPPDEHAVLPEDVAGLVHTVYDRRQDPKLLAGLLDLSPYTDGCLAEGMGVILHDVARKTPRTLLLELQRQPQRVWQSVPDLISFDLDPEVPVQRSLPELYQISRKDGDPLQSQAERLLRVVGEGLRAQYGEGCALDDAS